MLRPCFTELYPQYADALHLVAHEPIAQIIGKEEVQLRKMLQALTLNALFYGEKCLIVSSDAETGEMLKAYFQSKNLDPGWIAIGLEGSEAPLPAASTAKRKIKDPYLFSTKLQKLERYFHYLNDAYLAVRSPLWGSFTWFDLLASYWTSRELSDVELPTVSNLDDGFIFKEEEYYQLRTALGIAQPLYSEVKSLQSPLQVLHPRLFQQQDLRATSKWVEEKLKAFLARVETLIQKYHVEIISYKRDIQQHYERSCTELVNEVEQALDAIEDAVQQHGMRFMDARLGNRNWLKKLNASNKTAQQRYQELTQRYEKVKQRFQQFNWFVFPWPKMEKNKPIRFVQSTLIQFVKVLKDEQRNLPQFAQEEALRLSSKSVHTAWNSQSRIVALEEEMEELLLELNEAELLAQTLVHRTLTLSKRQQFLRQLHQQLGQLSQSFSGFEEFYPWQKLYLSLYPPAQNMIKALVESQSQHWEDTFSAWYFLQVLIKVGNMDMSSVPAHLEMYHQNWQLVQELAPDHLAARRSEILKTTRESPISQIPILCITHQDWLKLPDQMKFKLLISWGKDNLDATQIKAYRAKASNVVILYESTDQLKNLDLPDQLLDTVAPDQPSSDTFWSHFQQSIKPYFAAEEWSRNEEWEGLRLPLTLKIGAENQQKVVFLVDGFLSETAATDFAWEYLQQQRLHAQGWKIIPVWSMLCWQNLPEECRKIAAQIILWQKEYKVKSEK